MFRLIFLTIQLIIAVLSLLLGIVFFLKPADCIKMQQNFYKIINWKIEPIHYNKEIRNTRLIGVVCVVCAFIMLIILIKIRL
jgi:hypothetical protein